MLLYQDINGYGYNSDTIFLYDFVCSFSPKGNVLDVGAGCGILGLLIARDFDINLSLIEKQENHFMLIEKNIYANKIDAKVYHQDFASFKSDEKFDFIVSNPPFYNNGVTKTQNEAIAISRYSSFLPFEIIVRKVNSIIKPKGEFIFCYEAICLVEIVSLLKEFKFTVSDIRFVHPKIEKNSSLILVRAKKSSNSKTKIHNPLIVHQGEDFTQEVKNMFIKANTYSIKCNISKTNIEN